MISYWLNWLLRNRLVELSLVYHVGHGGARLLRGAACERAVYLRPEIVLIKINGTDSEKLDRFTKRENNFFFFKKLMSFLEHTPYNWFMKFNTRLSLCGRGLEWWWCRSCRCCDWMTCLRRRPPTSRWSPLLPPLSTQIGGISSPEVRLS